jgi:nucleoside-diphosphate-sugar epimerase
MKRALIGHTGFLGATLLADGGFTHGFDSPDFQDMRGARFDEVVCAGIPAAEFPVTQEPGPDRAAIAALLDVLATVRADRFILISTIDVYPDPAQPLDETAVLEGLTNHPYGEVEKFVTSRFPNHAVVRLPALFGEGLKGNALYDLLHDNNVEKINPAAQFQWYPTRRLPGDLVRMARAGLRLVNLVTEPIALRDVIRRFFPTAGVGPESEPAPRYALRTRHAELFGGTAPYITGRSQVLLAMGDFIKNGRRR